jgi:citrate lyase subunit beta/citryl-CoA lyase
MLRSMLFAPGDQPRKVQKALTELAADAVILDLEDAVAVSAKVGTRQAVAAALDLPRRCRVYVRVNGVDTPWFFGDLDAVVQPGLDGIVLPKTGRGEVLYLADRYITHLETERGLTPGAIDLLPLIESAEGLANLREICGRSGSGSGADRSPTDHRAAGIRRVRRLGFGAADFTADLGFSWTAEEPELLLARTQLALYSRWAGLEPPIDTVYPHFRDLAGLEATSRRARELGFQGRTCIHPDQVEPLNRIFQPTAEELAWAEDVVTAFEAAEAQGVAAIQVRGQLIDYAFVVRARQLLRQAGREPPASDQQPALPTTVRQHKDGAA